MTPISYVAQNVISYPEKQIRAHYMIFSLFCPELVGEKKSLRFQREHPLCCHVGCGLTDQYNTDIIRNSKCDTYPKKQIRAHDMIVCLFCPELVEEKKITIWICDFNVNVIVVKLVAD